MKLVSMYHKLYANSLSLSLFPVKIVIIDLRCIEPGGYLQWEEPNDDASKRPIVKADPSNSSENAEKLLQKMDARFRAKTPAS